MREKFISNVYLTLQTSNFNPKCNSGRMGLHSCKTLTFVDELCGEVVSLQIDNVQLFDEYQYLKKDYNILLLHMVEKDEIVQGLQDYK